MAKKAEQRLVVGELIAPEIEELLAAADPDGARETMLDLLDPELADVIEALDEEPRAVAFAVLPAERAAAVLDLLPSDVQEELVERLSPDHTAAVVSEMPVDDRVELVGDLSDELAEPLLESLEASERAETERQLEYPEGSVGRLMTADYLTVRPEWTVERALGHLRERGAEAETLDTLYVVDGAGRLTDQVRLKTLVLAEPGQVCDALREGHVVSVKVEDDQEQVVYFSERYDTPVLPVVDGENVLVGIVTFDDVADVAEEETTEDVQKMGAVQALEHPYLSASLMELVKKRGVWLAILFVAGIVTVFAMGQFHEQLQDEKLAILALFIPLIIASGGNSGTQAASLIIRAMAIGEVDLRDAPRVARRELASGLLLGSVLGVLGMAVTCVVGLWLFREAAHPMGEALHAGFAIGTAIVGVVVTGTLIGGLLPFALKGLGADPATCSTPFVTTLVDVAGLVIYFLTASLILRM